MEYVQTTDHSHTSVPVTLAGPAPTVMVSVYNLQEVMRGEYWGRGESFVGMLSSCHADTIMHSKSIQVNVVGQ